MKTKEFINKYKNKDQACVYMLWSGSNVIYVGSTKYPSARIRSHQSSIKEFDSVSAHECNDDELLDLETKFIIKLKPKYNSSIPSSTEYVLMSKRRDEASLIAARLVGDLPVEIIGTRKHYVSNNNYLGLMEVIQSSAKKYLDEINFNEGDS